MPPAPPSCLRPPVILRGGRSPQRRISRVRVTTNAACTTHPASPPFVILSAAKNLARARSHKCRLHYPSCLPFEGRWQRRQALTERSCQGSCLPFGMTPQSRPAAVPAPLIGEPGLAGARRRGVRGPLHSGRTPPGWQHPSRRSEQSGRDGRAMRAPAGWQLAPPCCNSKWAAAAKRDPASTRAARPEGKGDD